MNTGVVHDNDRVGTRILIHVVEESINKTIEFLCSIGVVLDSKMEDPIKREGRKNRVSVSQ
jgi:hypothetical protein